MIELKNTSFVQIILYEAFLFVMYEKSKKKVRYM